jgi:very-short-patch-repair endonuclease
MSLNNKQNLKLVAKQLCRSLRKNSTQAEQIMWDNLRNRKFLNKKFYRQHPIFFDLLGKETFYIADFYCYEEKLIIEIDGGYHLRQKDYDTLRTQMINLLNIKVIRFTNDQVINNLKNVLEELSKIINANSL